MRKLLLALLVGALISIWVATPMLSSFLPGLGPVVVFADDDDQGDDDDDQD